MITMPTNRAEQTKAPMDLWDFSKIASHGIWQPIPHINLIIEFLHYALNGQIENFACALSPRLGKSMQVSEIFPAYYLGMRPYGKVILLSYGDELARSFGEKARNTFKEFGHLFPENPRLSPDSQSKSRFTIDGHEGEFYCGSISGGVLGRGGNLIIVDDPLKNMEQAESETYQEKIKQLFDTTITTRKEKDRVTGQKAIVIVIHQRLNKNDLIGIILDKEDWITAEEALPRLRRGEKLGHTWVYLRLPELAEENDILGRQPGEALWPDKRDEEELNRIQTNIGYREFNAVHQQDPKEREGKYFKPEYFEEVDYLPNDEIIQEIQWSDLAATYYPPEVPISQRGAATATIRLALTKDRRLFITFMDEMWEEEDVVANNIIEIAKNRGNKPNSLAGKKPKFCIPQDPGQAGKGQVKKYSLLLPGYNFEGIIETGNKEDRAEAPSTWAKINHIYIYNKAPGVKMLGVHGSNREAIKRFKRVVSDFPNNKHKDFVDAISGAFGELDIPDEYVDYALPESMEL